MSSQNPPPLDLNNIQGDVLSGLPKKTETYVFFQIDDNRVNDFRKQLCLLVPLLTTTAQVLDDRKRIQENKKDAAKRHCAPPTLKMSGVQVAFSHKGLVKMGINDEIGDKTFDAGMLADAQTLGDQGKTTSDAFDPDWNPAFKQDIHGLLFVSGESHATVAEKLAEIHKIFKVGAHDASMYEVIRLGGDVRPGSEKGHEHFGFLDGISNPAVKDVDKSPLPGQGTVRQGIILLGREGDAPDVPNVTRPPWALDGSFLSFRQLFQLVPEFDTFLEENPIPSVPDRKLGSQLLGARMVGRWKSGAPIDITPVKDDPELGADPQRNNDFRYDFPDDFETQTRCPFAAHTRKTFPRGDFEDLPPPTGPLPTENRRIMRRGIPFGPEVTPEETAKKTTIFGRGLLFVCYQSTISAGFQFIQQAWANNPNFPIGKPIATPGFDPIVGQASDPTSRTLSGTDPSDQDMSLALPTQWVVPRGGEYFFTPSISALKETFALVESSSPSRTEL